VKTEERVRRGGKRGSLSARIVRTGAKSGDNYERKRLNGGRRGADGRLNGGRRGADGRPKSPQPAQGWADARARAKTLAGREGLKAGAVVLRRQTAGAVREVRVAGAGERHGGLRRFRRGR